MDLIFTRTLSKEEKNDNRIRITEKKSRFDDSKAENELFEKGVSCDV